MKQNISTGQLNELSDKAKEKLREWWVPKEGDLCTDGIKKMVYCGDFIGTKEKIFSRDYREYPLLSIGQMLEFLAEKNPDDYGVSFHYVEFHWPEDKDLCDALWGACKEILGDGK